jgi:RNA polymerase sigma-70 factor, ECF subfamily
MAPSPETTAGSAFSNTTSTSLLERVKARDAAAWQRLVDVYAPLIYRWCRHCGLQSDDALDVGQEVLASVLRGIGAFRRQQPGDSFRGWLWTITHNKLRDHLRKLHRQGRAPGGTDAFQRLAQIAEQESASVSSPPGPEPAGLERRALELVQASVEPKTFQAFWLVTVEGRSPAEAAQQLGISVQAVYDARYRLRRRVRQELADLLDQ